LGEITRTSQPLDTMVGRYYAINLTAGRKEGKSNYVDKEFKHVEEAIMYAQDRGWITYNEEEDKYEDRIGLEIVEFYD